MTFTGKIHKVDQRNGRVQIGDSEPPLENVDVSLRYARTIEGDLGESSLRRGQRVQFEVQKRRGAYQAVHIILLDEDPSVSSEAPAQKEEVDSFADLSGLAQPTDRLTEYQAFIIDQIYPELEQLPSAYSRAGKRSNKKRVVKKQIDSIIDHIDLSSSRPPNRPTAPLWRDENLVYTLIYQYFNTGDRYAINIADDVRGVWQSSIVNTDFQRIPDAVGLSPLDASMTPPVFHFNLLPKPSFLIAFRFRLAKPYISRDDEPVYIIDNPVVKEKLFGMPMVKPSTWKGHLRMAMVEMMYHPSNQITQTAIDRLFGPGKDKEELTQGRLHFYPTFFGKVSLEVINPHNRSTRAGERPILFEAVPAGEAGDFYLLYSPLGDDLETSMAHAQQDLRAVMQGIPAMFTEYGFSAKKTDGYGIATERIQPVGDSPVLWTNAPEIADFEWEEGVTTGTAVRSFQRFDQLLELVSNGRESDNVD